MTYKPLRRPWKVRNPVYWLMIAELTGLVPILILFGIAQPNWYRTQFWKIGYENGWNSNPDMVLYAYANYEPIPTIPFVWSQTLTNLNVAISVISLFFLLTKLIAFIMRVWYPLVAIGANIGLVTIYTVSTYGQIGPDHADDKYSTDVVWYIAKPCSVVDAYGSGVVHKCKMAKGALAVTVYMLFLYLCNLGLAIWSMIPTEADKVDTDNEDSDGPEKPTGNLEMASMKSPGLTNVPFTPRTQAFNQLGSDQPQIPRAYYSAV